MTPEVLPPIDGNSQNEAEDDIGDGPRLLPRDAF